MCNKTDISIENYISEKNSICREERQYALFLNDILYKYKSPADRSEKKIAEIFKACHIPENAEVKHVFYEATFMRDFYNNDKRAFNIELIKYIKKILGDQEFLDESVYNIDKPYNLGSKKFNHGAAVRSMMNSKPDIAVIYCEDEQNYLLFLECKYLSNVSSNGEKITQTKAQWLIADFLCNNYLKDINTSPEMINNSCIVKFGKDGIPIETLIQLNNEVFK